MFSRPSRGARNSGSSFSTLDPRQSTDLDAAAAAATLQHKPPLQGHLKVHQPPGPAQAQDRIRKSGNVQGVQSINAQPPANRQQGPAQPATTRQQPHAQQKVKGQSPHLQPTSTRHQPYVQQTAKGQPPNAQQTATRQQPHVQATATRRQSYAQQTATRQPQHPQSTATRQAPNAQATTTRRQSYAQQTATRQPHAQTTATRRPSYAQPTATRQQSHSITHPMAKGQPSHTQQTPGIQPPHPQPTVSKTQPGTQRSTITGQRPYAQPKHKKPPPQRQHYHSLPLFKTQQHAPQRAPHGQSSFQQSIDVQPILQKLSKPTPPETEPFYVHNRLYFAKTKALPRPLPPINKNVHLASNCLRLKEGKYNMIYFSRCGCVCFSRPTLPPEGTIINVAYYRCQRQSGHYNLIFLHKTPSWLRLFTHVVLLVAVFPYWTCPFCCDLYAHECGCCD